MLYINSQEIIYKTFAIQFPLTNKIVLEFYHSGRNYVYSRKFYKINSFSSSSLWPDVLELHRALVFLVVPLEVEPLFVVLRAPLPQNPVVARLPLELADVGGLTPGAVLKVRVRSATQIDRRALRGILKQMTY